MRLFFHFHSMAKARTLLVKVLAGNSLSPVKSCLYRWWGLSYLYLSIKGRRRWHPTPVLLPGKSHGWRSLVGCSPWGHEESDTTEWLHFDFSLSCTGEGNGNPLQCSCLENPRDKGACWAAVYGVAQSRTRLKWLSSLAATNKNLSYSTGNSAQCYVTIQMGKEFEKEEMHVYV